MEVTAPLETLRDAFDLNNYQMLKTDSICEFRSSAKFTQKAWHC